LIRPIYAMSRDFKELLDSLEKLEAYPSSILLEEEAKNIPEALRNLFRRTCDVMNHVTPLVEKPFGFLFASASSRIVELNQLLVGFADRFEYAQLALRTRVSGNEYRDSIMGYKNCTLEPDQAVEEDLKESHVGLPF